MLTIRDLVVAVGRPGDELVLLRGADLRVPEGSAVVIRGGQGSGKSTLAAVLRRELRPRFGRIDGRALVIDDADRMPPGRLAALLEASRARGETPVLLAADERFTGAARPADLVFRLDKGMLIAESERPGKAPVPERPAEAGLRIPADELRERAAASLRGVGCTARTADLVAAVLVEADVRGHHSHGIGLLPTYLRRVAAGGVDPTAEPTLSEDGAVARVDAHAGFGQPAAMAAAEWCAAAAARDGVAAVGVHGNNHVGMMAAYRRPFQREGVVGLLLNVSGPSLTAPGAVRPTLGSNAVCMVTPTDRDEPFVVDFATGVVAIGKVRAAAQRGEPVPAGWLRDAAGLPTSDPADLERGGSVPLFGDYKGLCVTLIAEVLAGMLGGQTVSPLVAKQRAQPEQPMNCSQLFIGLSPSAFGLEQAGKLLGILEDAVAGGHPDGPPVPYFPDQMEAASTAEALEHGVPVPASVASDLGWA
ncbi:Ldh family oxidoreductase [Actinomadura macra]|uniref:Ldh family oxidoreductase n=1 Tax=Actinomadura macra TaxID=46164 RepID=UPI000837551E|nr:Ldh family oxidoreductase [Actinomadura macra]